ncbi:MAG: BACON domain-containing protein, partial [Vicinamibacterales bacterium]
MRYLTGFILVIAAGVGCSRVSEQAVAASPTSPTAAVSADSAITYVGGVSGPMDVLFPGRNDSFQLRNDLEAKYQQMGRSVTSTFVDREGEVVWTQEYIRYRVNGCDHATAVTRVMTQIDGGVAGGICGSPPEGLILFPSRADSLQFRRELETKYQQMGRGLQSTFVDQEGAVIWIQEYLRYRVNNCDHATAASKVFSQIDGGPVPATCFVACVYTLLPTAATIEYTPASLSFQVRPDPGGCDWQASSDASWLTFQDDMRTGSGLQTFAYSVAQNNGTSERTGRIRFTWTGGGTTFTVTQRGIPFVASFTMFDPFKTTNSTTECEIRSSPTPCNFVVNANLPGGNYTYQWRISYRYGIDKVISQIVTTPTFSFSDSCGATGSNSSGETVDLNVTL